MIGTRYAWDFSFLWSYRGLILTGLGVTIAYTIGTILLGLVVGLVTGLLRLSRNVLITAPLVAYVEVFRCTPLPVQILWFYYALPVVLDVDIRAHVAATLVLSLYTGAFYAEIIRGGVNSIERGAVGRGTCDRNAVRASHAHVVLPQAIKRMIPPYMNQSIIQLKNTSLVSTIAVGRSALSGHDHHGGDLLPARGLYDGRGDLFLSAVPADIGGPAG
jgi:polar amino acid transport system permease protein